MPKTALHIFFSNVTNETRLFKEAHYVIAEGILDRVIVLGFWADGLEASEVTSGGLEIRRLKTWIRQYKSTALLTRLTTLRKIIRALSLLQYSAKSIAIACRLRPSHVSCHNLSMLPLAWVAARLSGAHLIYVPHELETERACLSGIRKRIETWVEKHFVYLARDVVVVCDPIADWYRATYGLNNVQVVRNVPQQNAVTVRDLPGGGFRKRFSIPDSATVFIYQGMFGPERGTDELLRVFAEIDPNQSHLVLMGYGDPLIEEEIRQNVARYENIHFQPAVAIMDIVSYSAGADVGVWVNNDTSTSYCYSLPNKFYEYGHAGLALVVSENLEYQAQFIRENNLGTVTSYARLKEDITRLSKTDLSGMRTHVQSFAETAVWENDATAYRDVYRP